MRRLAPRVLTASFVVATATSLLSSFSPVSAASLSQSFIRFDRMQINAPTTGTVCAKPTTTAVEGKVIVTFPTGYTVSPTAGNWVTSTTNLAWPTGGTAWPTLSAPVIAGQAVTFTSGDLTVGTLYCFNWTNNAAVSIAATATASNIGSIATQTAAAAAIDSSTFATASLSNDQIQVSASVAQTFSFALSGTSDALGNLSSSTITSSPTARTATVNTNAKNGWYVWANDSASAGLSSASAGTTIASTTPGTNSTLTTGVEGYNTGVTSAQTGGTGTVTVAAPFVGGSTGKGGGLNNALQTIASSNGTANGAVLTLTNNASISPTTSAATDYADTITVVGAGLF